MELTYDTMREVLLRSNADTIRQYCRTSTVARLLCQDERFWREKFTKDNIYFPLVWEGDDTYLDMYDLLSKNIGDIRIILKINKIERNRIYETTNGIMIIVVEDMNEDNLGDLLNYKIKCGQPGVINYNELQFHLTDEG